MEVYFMTRSSVREIGISVVLPSPDPSHLRGTRRRLAVHPGTPGPCVRGRSAVIDQNSQGERDRRRQITLTLRLRSSLVLFLL